MHLVKLKKTFVAWLLIISCVQALSSLALGSIFPATGSDHSKRLQLEQKVQRMEGTIRLNGDGKAREYVVKPETVYQSKAQRGRGTYGGANIVHQPRKGAASQHGRPSIYISATVCVSFGLLLVSLN